MSEIQTIKRQIKNGTSEINPLRIDPEPQKAQDNLILSEDCKASPVSDIVDNKQKNYCL
jgi:hypothetical protein